MARERRVDLPVLEEPVLWEPVLWEPVLREPVPEELVLKGPVGRAGLQRGRGRR